MAKGKMPSARSACERQETCGQLQDCSGDDREYGRKRIPGSGYADDKGQTDSGSER